MTCQSDDESGIFRALAMSAQQTPDDPLKAARMNEALALRQKMNPSGRRSLPVLSPRHTPSMFEDTEEGDDEDYGDISSPVNNGGENDEPNVKVASSVTSPGRVGRGGRGGRLGGRSALLARLNLKNDGPSRTEEKGRITSSQFQNQLSSRFKTTKHQVRRLASSDNED